MSTSGNNRLSMCKQWLTWLLNATFSTGTPWVVFQWYRVNRGGSRISQTGEVTKLFLAVFPRKLHENERNWTGDGGSVPGAYPPPGSVNGQVSICMITLMMLRVTYEWHLTRNFEGENTIYLHISKWWNFVRRWKYILKNEKQEYD